MMIATVAVDDAAAQYSGTHFHTVCGDTMLAGAVKGGACTGVQYFHVVFGDNASTESQMQLQATPGRCSCIAAHASFIS